MYFQDPPCLHDDIYAYIKELLGKNTSTNETCEFESRDSDPRRSMKSDLDGNSMEKVGSRQREPHTASTPSTDK